MKTVGQFWRTVVSNSISAGIDYGILFLLVYFTGITSGNGIIPLNMISFAAGAVNSFYFNKHWSFGDHSGLDVGRKFTLFLLVSITALLVNTLMVRLISTEVSPLFGLTDVKWLLFAKVIASGFSFSTNFLGYKFIVFKK